MNLKKIMLGSAASVMLLAGQAVMADDDLKTLTDRVSYLFGYNAGMRFQQEQIDINAEVFAKAMQEAQKGDAARMSEEDMASTMRAFQDLQQAKMAEVAKVVGEANKKEGDAYLAANAKKDGVKTTTSGLQYKVINKGSGEKPSKNSQVSVHYRGTLIDGTEFDSSYSRGEPAVFGVTQVIPGWTEVLQMMPEGSKWEVVIPSELAYGAGGAGGKIGPNATLVFEIELLDANVN